MDNYRGFSTHNKRIEWLYDDHDDHDESEAVGSDLVYSGIIQRIIQRWMSHSITINQIFWDPGWDPANIFSLSMDDELCYFSPGRSKWPTRRLMPQMPTGNMKRIVNAICFSFSWVLCVKLCASIAKNLPNIRILYSMAMIYVYIYMISLYSTGSYKMTCSNIQQHTVT